MRIDLIIYKPDFRRPDKNQICQPLDIEISSLQSCEKQISIILANLWYYVIASLAN
jgi:hypothetical protein